MDKARMPDLTPEEKAALDWWTETQFDFYPSAYAPSARVSARNRFQYKVATGEGLARAIGHYQRHLASSCKPT